MRTMLTMVNVVQIAISDIAKAAIPDKIVDTSPLPPIQCWSTLSSGRNSLVGLLIAEPTLNRGEGGEKKIVSGSSGGNTMCMTDDISKNGQN